MYTGLNVHHHAPMIRLRYAELYQGVVIDIANLTMDVAQYDHCMLHSDLIPFEGRTF